MESVFLNSNHFGEWELGILSLKMWITEKHKQPWQDEWSSTFMYWVLALRWYEGHILLMLIHAYFQCHVFILGFYLNLPIKHVRFPILSSAAALWDALLSSCLFKASKTRSALIGQLTRAWASTVSVCLWLALSCFQRHMSKQPRKVEEILVSMLVEKSSLNTWGLLQ